MTVLPKLSRTLAVALVLGLALTGCSSKTKTGSGVVTKDGGNANLNLGGTPTATRKATTPAVVRTTPPVVRTKPPVRTAAPARTTRATQAPVKAFPISIYSDTSGQRPLSPPDVSVYANTPITWTNRDTKPHSVVAVNGAFRSPDIAPGKTFTWTPTAAGKYDYSDGHRPYVNGQIQVTAR